MTPYLCHRPTPVSVPRSHVDPRTPSSAELFRVLRLTPTERYKNQDPRIWQPTFMKRQLMKHTCYRLLNHINLCILWQMYALPFLEANNLNGDSYTILWSSCLQLVQQVWMGRVVQSSGCQLCDQMSRIFWSWDLWREGSDLPILAKIKCLGIWTLDCSGIVEHGFSATLVVILGLSLRVSLSWVGRVCIWWQICL